jgi:hypothetical protein
VRGGPDAQVAVMGRRERLAAVRADHAVAAGVPAELRGVPALAAGATRTRERETLLTRRLTIREKSTSTRSTRTKLADEALVAAAMVMDPTAQNAPAPNAVTRTWQHAAYGYVNTVPELNAARMYVGNALSRCTLAVGKRNPDGSVEQGYDGEEPVEGLDSTVAEEAADLISQIRSPRGGQSELLRSSGEKMFVSGELYYVPKDGVQGMEFDILSTQELLRDGATWTKYLGPGYGAEPLPEGVSPVRVWRPDGQWSMLATSSVRSCLEILEELVVLTRLVRSSAISRMALAGVFFVPDELDTPDDPEGPDGGESEAMNPLAVDMINTGAKAIDDPANASAWMPFIIQGPAEYGAHLRHIPFEASNEQQVIQRTEAIMRLARGLDLPVEVITGHADTTFANAAQVNIDVFRIHLEPTLQLVCDALTQAYLWPAMAKARGIDAEELLAGTVPWPDEILSVAVTYDAHHLVSRPDRTKELLEVYGKDITQMTIKIAEMRDALNLDPDEVVDPMEVAARVDAIRLTKIRETIAAPPTDAAVGIASIDQAVVPGSSAGADLIEQLGTDDSRTPSRSKAIPAKAQLAYRVAGAVEVTVARSIERLGAKLRAKAKGPERERWSSVSNATLAQRLGTAEVGARLGADADTVLAVEAQALAAHVGQWAAEAELDHPVQAGQQVAVLAIRMTQALIAGQDGACTVEDIAGALLAVQPVPVG